MRRNFIWKPGLVLTALIFIQAYGQSSHYLTQKIELENTIAQRISTAIERILGNRNFIVDVKADVEFQPERKIEEVYKPSQKSIQVRRAESPAKDERVPGVETSPSQERKAPRTDIYRDILPGIPGGVFEAELPLIDDQANSEGEIIPPAADDEPMPSVAPPADEIENEEELYSRSVSQLQERVPILRKLDISIILQEGVHPNLVESVRQVAMVAAHFDRKRGDVLSIMTTAFKLDEPRKELEATSQPIAQYRPSKEESARDEETRKLISDIQRQIENLNDKMRNASVSNQPSPSENILLGIIDKLTARKSLQDDIETQRLLAEQQVRLRLLAQDTSRLKKLQDEIAALKLQLAIQKDDRMARGGMSDESAQKLKEKEELEAAIAEKINLLASTQAQLNNRSATKAPLWVWLLAALMLISLFSGSLYWMQRSKKAAVAAASAASEAKLRKKLLADLEQDKVVRSAKAKAPDPEEEDEELAEIRSSIVNLSVANPDAASALMRKWLKESGDEGAAETDSKGENKNG